MATTVSHMDGPEPLEVEKNALKACVKRWKCVDLHLLTREFHVEEVDRD